MPTQMLPNLVLLLPVVPLVAAVVVALLGPGRGNAVRWVSLLATIVGLIMAAIIAAGYCARPPDDSAATTFRPVFVPGATAEHQHETTWNMLPLGSGAIQFYFGIDGLNVWLLLLTALLMVPSVLISWTAVNDRVNEYYAWLLALGAGLQGVFLSFDVILFYVFFELTLVPLFFLIGIWGGPQRQYAARKFFIYTLAGSMITFLGVLAIVLMCYKPPTGNDPGSLTFSIPELVQRVQQLKAGLSGEDLTAWLGWQKWIFLALMVGFSIKVPLVPVHTWLPLAHTEAPTAGSVLLAGVLLKIGSYGFLRLCIPLAPEASLSLGVPLIGTLSVIGIIYGAFCALAQDDVKKLVAYSSVSHLGFCMLGMFALGPNRDVNEVGLSGSLMQMINHGLSTGGLFLLVGMLYERYHTRKMSDYGGMAAKLKILAFFMVFICLTSVGLPGLNGFIGESLVLFASFGMQKSAGSFPILAALAATGIVLGAWYLFTMLRKVFFGPVKEPHHEGHAVTDLNGRELATILPLAVICIIIGVHPMPVLEASKQDIKVVADIVAKAAHQPASARSTAEDGK